MYLAEKIAMYNVCYTLLENELPCPNKVTVAKHREALSYLDELDRISALLFSPYRDASSRMKIATLIRNELPCRRCCYLIIIVIVIILVLLLFLFWYLLFLLQLFLLILLMLLRLFLSMSLLSLLPTSSSSSPLLCHHR